MSVAVVRAILIAASPVTAIAGQQISPLIKSQGITPPAVTLQRINLSPQNNLRDNGHLDAVSVQLDAWGATYTEALALAAACRAAIEAAGYSMQSELDNYDPDVDPGLYRITQDYLIWV